MSEAVHRRGRIGTDGSDDLVHVVMIARAGIVAPRAAVALQQQRRMVGTALAAAFSLAASSMVTGTEKALLFRFHAVSAPPLAAFDIISFGRTG